jgi:hypothetical protein
MSTLDLSEQEGQLIEIFREWGGVDAYRLAIERRDGAWDVSLKQLGGPPDNRAAARGTGATFDAACDDMISIHFTTELRCVSSLAARMDETTRLRAASDGVSVHWERAT